MSLFVAPFSAVSLTAATAKTIRQLVPAANAPIRLRELCISFDGVAATNVPVLVELLRQTTGGTSTSQTPVPESEADSKAALATYRDTITAEPTAGSVLRSWYVTPAGGLLIVQWAPGEGPEALTYRLGLRATAPNTVNCAGSLTFEE